MEKSCFFCDHLILDGFDSWCEIQHAGKVCKDYVENKERIAFQNERKIECELAKKLNLCSCGRTPYTGRDHDKRYIGCDCGKKTNLHPELKDAVNEWNTQEEK